MNISSLSMGGFSRLNSQTTVRADQTTSTENTFGKKNTSSLPDEVVENIQKMAREGAKKGVYMGDQYGAYINAYKTQHISPNRSKLISLMTPMLMNAKYTNGLPSFFQLPGLPFTGMLQVGARNGASMSIYDNSGTEILSYDCRNGWLPHQSQAEGEFYDETTAIYHEAYAAARAEMQTGSVQSSGIATISGLDMKA